MDAWHYADDYDISIHALREEGDRVNGMTPKDVAKISIHALREEGDAPHTQSCPVVLVFLSTPSARRATASRSFHSRHLRISIHALREEGDP